MTINPTIRVNLKDVYGETKAYPVCPNAKIFAEMLGTKTLTRQALANIRRLGYEVEVEQIGVVVGRLAA